jgi:CRP-like cAMP-binding protein
VTKPTHAGTTREVGGHCVANRILLALPATSWERVKAHLQPTELPHGKVIYFADAPMKYLYFINRGLISLLKRMEDGRCVEIGAVGTEGLAGIRSLYGIERALWDSIVQIGGDAFRIDQEWLQGELTRNKELRELLKRCHFLSVSQLAQTAACNRLHPLRQRCCSWLLFAHDSARSDSFKFTHEFLGMMLGVQRVRVTIMVKNLQKDGIIRYTRAKMIIANRSALESSACECYRTIRKQSDQLLGLSES